MMDTPILLISALIAKVERRSQAYTTAAICNVVVQLCWCANVVCSPARSYALLQAYYLDRGPPLAAGVRGEAAPIQERAVLCPFSISC